MIKVGYITGTGRSGTNITKDILSLHPDIATLPFEHRFTVDPPGILPFYKDIETWSPYIANNNLLNLEKFLLRLANKDQLKSLINKIVKNKLTPFPYADWELNKWIPGYEKYVYELLEGLKTYTYHAKNPLTPAFQKDPKMYFYGPKKPHLRTVLSSFMESCHRSIVQSQNKTVFVEDNTWTYLFSREILELTPEGKILFIVRDPRDTVSSMTKQGWTPTDIRQTIVYYSTLMKQWFKIKKQLPENAYIEIKLEELLLDTKTFVNKLCDFLEIDSFEIDGKIDLTKSNSGRYKKLTSEVQTILNSELKTYISHYGYN